MASRGEGQPLNNSNGEYADLAGPSLVGEATCCTHRGSATLLLFLGHLLVYAGDANVPSNVTNSPVVESKANDKGETPADTKVKVDDAVVAKAPDGEEVDFKKISVDEALKVLKVCI